MIHCNNGCLQNRRLDIQNLGYVSYSLFLGYDIQYLKWLEMQRHALSTIQLNQRNYQAPYSVYRNSLLQFQESSSSHVRMPICTPGSSNTINDDESLRMPTKVSYGPNIVITFIHELLNTVKAPSCKTTESLRKIL